MRNAAAWMRLFAALVLSASVAFADPKDDTPSKPEAKKSNEKLVSAGQAIGKLIEVSRSEKQVTIQVTIRVPILNPPAAARHNQLVAQLFAASWIPHPVIRYRQMDGIYRQILENQRDVLKFEERKQDVPVHVMDEAKVRTAVLPLYDDKGNFRRYTAKELKELKGPDLKLPGYASEFDHLSRGQIVRVHLAKRVPLKKDPDAPPADNKPEISMIVILAEPEP